MTNPVRLLCGMILLFCFHGLHADVVTFDATKDIGNDKSKATQNASLTKDGITIQVSWGTLGRGDSYRCYATHTFTVSSSVGNITKIEITSPVKGKKEYGPGYFVGTGYTYKDYTGTWTGNETSVSLVSKLYQIQMTKVVVTYERTHTPDVSVTVSPVGFASLYYSDRAILVPENIKAYTIKLSGNSLQKSHCYMPGEVIPASTGVVIEGAANNYSFASTTETGFTDHDNMLLGTDQQEMMADDGNSLYYQLSLDKNNTPGSIGFYWGTEHGAPFVNGAHKAYLKIDKSTNAKRSLSFHQDITNISSPFSSTTTEKHFPIYNLSGQRVDGNYQGIVIQKGKKILLRPSIP